MNFKPNRRSSFLGIAMLFILSFLLSCSKDTTITQEQPTAQVTPPPTTQVLKILNITTFEDNGYLNIWQKELALSNSLTLSDVVARKGKYSARFELGKQDPITGGGKRAELAQQSETESERWYAFSNYFPTDYDNDPQPEIVAQWHEMPDFDLGETWRSPPISLWIQDGQFKVNMMWATDAVNTNSTVSGQKIFHLGNVEKGVWIDWVFHIKFSWQGDGILEVWKNKEKVISYNGPNSYNDKKFPYFKIGIYKWPWNDITEALKSPEGKRVLYYDEIRVGDKNADLDTVSPQ